MARKPVVGLLLATFGAAAFAAGWTRGHLSGIRRGLMMVENLKRFAECRGEGDGCQWVYPQGHPRAGEPFGEHPPDGKLRSVERTFRCLRPFAGVPLLETIEFDVARRLPRRPPPPNLPPWWEPGTESPRASKVREHFRRQDERVRRQREAMRHLRRRLFGGLRVRARRDRSLTVEAENTALVALEVRELRLTYVYRRPLVERLFGQNTPRMPLVVPSGEEAPPRSVAPGETLRWSVPMRGVEEQLEQAGMRVWPDTRLMRLNDPLSERLARHGGASLRVVNLLRRLTYWRLAVELVDGGGKSRKAELRYVPTWAQ